MLVSLVVYLRQWIHYTSSNGLRSRNLQLSPFTSPKSYVTSVASKAVHWHGVTSILMYHLCR